MKQQLLTYRTEVTQEEIFKNRFPLTHPEVLETQKEGWRIVSFSQQVFAEPEDKMAVYLTILWEKTK